ncbi:hypothetical protein HZS_6367 [Henneguya salminicola]|nr:hypothetical protein HZS_6367 [Henneguya salminicola]
MKSVGHIDLVGKSPTLPLTAVFVSIRRRTSKEETMKPSLKRDKYDFTNPLRDNKNHISRLYKLMCGMHLIQFCLKSSN